MIKDNHKLAAGGIAAAYRRVREAFPDVPVQVEVTTVAEAVEAVEAGADFLLLRQHDPGAAARGGRRGGRPGRAGGDRRADPARWPPSTRATGVDYLSVGALTHSSPILDIALDLRGHSG